MSPEGVEPRSDGATRWNPWRALRRTPSIAFWFAPLGGDRGRWTRTTDGDEILVDPALDRRTRQEVLAHELVHVERGIGFPAASAATMELEEERVWRIALDRLAPAAEVLAFARRRGSVGPVLVEDVAEEFDLSAEAAARVVQLLRLRAPPDPG